MELGLTGLLLPGTQRHNQPHFQNNRIEKRTLRLPEKRRTGGPRRLFRWLSVIDLRAPGPERPRFPAPAPLRIEKVEVRVSNGFVRAPVASSYQPNPLSNLIFSHDGLASFVAFIRPLNR